MHPRGHRDENLERGESLLSEEVQPGSKPTSDSQCGLWRWGNVCREIAGGIVCSAPFWSVSANDRTSAGAIVGNRCFRNRDRRVNYSEGTSPESPLRWFGSLPARLAEPWEPAAIAGTLRIAAAGTRKVARLDTEIRDGRIPS